jgi:amino acid transporter
VLPKAISLALLSCGLLVMFATLGLLLALPDLGAVLSGKDINPIATTLETRLGSGTGRAMLVMLTIGFTASMIAVQAAVSRAIWASARARELPASGLLGRLSGPERLPRHVIGLTCIVAGVLVFIHNPNVFTLLLSGATAGFFVSYALPVVAAAVTRLRGGWTPGPVSMGKAAAAVTYLAAVWMIAEIINIAWPRNTYGVWYLNWGIVLVIVVLGVLGALVSAYVFRPGGEAATAHFTPVVSDPEGE